MQTNWVVLTGAPCSGKTSVIRELEKKGHLVVHETARAFIDEALAKGLSLEAIKADVSTFEHRLLILKEKVEADLSPAALIFLDRAIPDSLAYFRHAGLDTAQVLEKSRLFRYKKIFLFERFRFKKDAVRTEDERTAEDLDRLLHESYEELGYEVMDVPVMPVVERVAFVLSHV